jgi:uncharacterized tellurite resistance protein B-like protein
MLNLVRKLFITPVDEVPAASSNRVELAAASLLVELMRADHEVSESERSAFLDAVERALGIEPAQVSALVDEALGAADAATSTYEFTSLINDNYSTAQKATLIETMWRIAYADGDLDKYEEHLIRKVAELTYVSHKDFIRLKLAALARQNS